jgi:hypothetical protein
LSQFSRKQTPPRFTNHRGYLPFLRIDFRRRCAYCERPEAYLGGEDFFTVDHFRPASKFPELTTHYPNLYYACGRCNQYKGGVWPTPNFVLKNLRFSDPCEEDMYERHLRELDDGKLESLTNCGQYTRDHIRLDRQDLLSWRLLRRQVAEDLRGFETAKARLTQTLSLVTGPTNKNKILEEIAAIESTVRRSREQFGL